MNTIADDSILLGLTLPLANDFPTLSRIDDWVRIKPDSRYIFDPQNNLYAKTSVRR
jgi:hypothetical protein